MQNLINFHPCVNKILRENEILTITNGHNAIVNLRKQKHNNSNLDLVMVNAQAKYDQIPSILTRY